MGKAIGSLYGVFGLKTDQFHKKLKNIERSLKKQSRNFKKIGDTINKNFTLPLAAVSVAAFKTSKDFNESMSNVATLIPDNVDRINELKESVQNLAIESGESTTELSEGLYNVVSALGESSESMDSLKLAAQSAKAGVGSIDDAIGLLAATTKGYGDTTFAAQKKVADFAQMTIKLGQTTLADLGVAIQQVTSLSSDLGVSQEELFSSFSSTTGVLGNASIVATQYKATLKSLVNPKEDLIKLYKKLGVESGKQLVAQKGLQGALSLIAKHAKDTKLPLQKLVGSAEAVAFTLSLTGAQSKKFKSDLDAMKNSTGALTEAYRQKTQGVAKLGFQYNQMVKTLVVTSQIMGDALAPAIERINEYLKPMLIGVKLVAEKFKSLSTETKNTIFDLTLLISAAGLSFTAISGLASVAAVGVSAMASLGVATTGLSKILLIHKGIVAGVIALWGGFEFGSFLNDQFPSLKKGSAVIIGVIKKLWENIKYIFKTGVDRVKAYMHSSASSFAEGIKVLLTETSRALMKYGGEIGEALAAPLRKMAKDFQKTANFNSKEAKKYYKALSDEYEIYKNKIASINNTTDAVIRDVQKSEIVSNNPKSKGANTKTPKELTAAEKAMKKLAREAEELRKKITAATNPPEIENGTDGIKSLGDAIDAAKEKSSELGSETNDSFEGLKRTTSQWKDQMADTFTDMAMRGELTSKSIGNSFKNMILSTMLKKGMSSLLGMIKIPGFAKGGRPKGLSMVGENGPELVDFGSTGAYIKSANETRSIMNGGGDSGASVNIHQTNVFNDNVSAAVQQEILKATPVLKSKIIAGVAEALERRELSFS